MNTVQPSKELLHFASYRVCTFAIRKCDCELFKRLPCHAVEGVAEAITHETIAEISKNYSLRKRKAAQK